MNRITRVLIFISTLLSVSAMSAADLSVTARLDSVNLLMGNMTTLHLQVIQNQGQKGGFTIFRDINPEQGYVGVCGDSVEMRTSYKIDTVELGSGRLQLNYEIPVQAFDSGTYQLPQFVYVAGNDSAKSNFLTFNVIPLNLTAEDPIAGFAPVAEPEGKKFYDAIPDWILDFWWVFIIIVAAIILFLWGMKRFKKEGTITFVPKRIPTPWEVAMESLANLKEKKLWEQGREKEYFTDLTDILRIYLEKRFGINAVEMTTRQILNCLYESDVKDKRDYIRQILNVADFVKFAKVRPLPADNIEAYENALKFVEETKPAPEEQPEDKNKETSQPEKGGES